MRRALEIKDEHLTIELILEPHALATFKAIDNDTVSGALRENNDIAVSNLHNETVHNPPCLSSLKDRLLYLCEVANETHDGKNTDTFIHPLVKAIILHFIIGFIHPFGDGNGRTARSLFYWYMLNAGCWLFEYISISKLIQEKKAIMTLHLFILQPMSLT